MRFEEAMKHLRSGKTIRRSSWGEGRFITTESMCRITTIHDILLDDWELLEKKVEITREQLIEAYNKTDEEYGYLCITDLADRLGL